MLFAFLQYYTKDKKGLIMGKIIKRLLKTIFVVAFLVYACVVMAKQEISFKKYDNELAEYNTRIADEELRHEQLVSTKNVITSNEYMEDVAREKLGLVMPNEIVFIDSSL